LNEFGVTGSWTKLFAFGPLIGIDNPLGFWKNDSMFLEKTDGQLVLYNPSTQEMINLQIDGVPKSLQVIPYTESLVSLRGGI
jgi:hypothetical protein